MGVEVAWRQVSKLLYEVVLPVSVNAHRHGIVHDVILLGDRMEDFINHWLFLMGGDLTEAEVVIKVVFFIARTQEPEGLKAPIHIFIKLIMMWATDQANYERGGKSQAPAGRYTSTASRGSSTEIPDSSLPTFLS